MRAFELFVRLLEIGVIIAVLVLVWPVLAFIIGHLFGG